ncbi:DUF6493 family protein [Dactylosporangium sp. CS-047395]|uniref:DUF6493 family protein n=1 Tax=Dactylosporangium sp. CS-047395 TaxID=3239936 RepID=UPI003D92E17A
MVHLPDLLAAPDEAVVPALSGLDAAARADLHRQVEAAFTADIEYRIRRQGSGPELTGRDRKRLKLCLVAVEPPADRIPRDDDEIRVATARGRRFLQASAEHAVRMMAGAGYRGWAWVAVRELERRGLVDLPPDDDYVLAVVGAFVDAARWSDAYTGPAPDATARTADRLLADPDLFDKVFWRLFEADRDRAASLTGADRDPGWPGSTWHEAVLDVIAAGRADRSRVLDATLAALARATSGYRAGWFVGLHRALAPSAAEIAARQPAYDLLLRSGIGPVVMLGLDALRTSPFDAPNLAAAVHAPGKAVALKALKLGGAPLAPAALDHPNADVRAAAAKLLGRTVPTSTAQPIERAFVQTAALVPLVPITDPAELAEAAAILVEHPEDAELAERVLCACARLGANPERMGGVARRAVRRAAADPVAAEALSVIGQVLAAAAGQRRFRDAKVPFKAGLLAARAREIADALLAGTPFTPLAEPTHAGGWIDPPELVRRLSTVDLHPADAVAALLRLGPDPASFGPALAADVPGPFGAALRHALGGPAPAAKGADVPYAIAAAQQRPALEPRLLLDGTIGFKAIGSWPPADPGPLLPTVALGTIDDHRDQYLYPVWGPWLATTWPANLDLPAALALLQWPDGTFGGFTAQSAHAPLPPIARLLMAAMLGAPRLTDRVAGTDAVLDLVPDRLAPADLGAAMAWLAPAVPLQRWADALRPLPSVDVAAILAALLPTLDRSRAGLFTLVELLADTGVPVPDGDLRDWLAGFTGTSKAARAASRMCS